MTEYVTAQANNGSETFLDLAATVVETLSVDREFKDAINANAAEYIRVLNQTAFDHMANAKLVERIHAIIAAVCVGVRDSVDAAFAANVPYTIKWAMQQHAESMETLSACMFCVSSLLTDDEAQTQCICELVNEEILSSAKAFIADVLFFMKVRALIHPRADGLR